MNPHVASTALTLVNSTVQSLKTAIELAKTSKDSDLKQTISEVFNGVLDLKSKVLDLEEENRTLRIAIAEKAAIKRSGCLAILSKTTKTVLCVLNVTSQMQSLHIFRMQSPGAVG
jgi:hypothetical protein